ncbi:hypothetical protein EGW08_006416, partial [Elysia chlorotica]
TGTTVNSEVTYSCMDGAVPTSPVIMITCEGSTGQWSPLQGSCSVVTCGQPPTLDTMNVELTPRSITNAYPGLDATQLQITYGAEAKYTCKPGWTTAEGASYISQCQSDGTWSPTTNFRCSAVDCGQPPVVANAVQRSYTDTTYGDNVTIACLSGFSPLDGLTLTCDHTGNWVGDSQTCEIVNCGDPPPRDNSVPTFTATTLNSMARYECNGSAIVELGDNSTSVCQENGEWSAVALTCVPSPCGEAPPVTNSRIEYKMDYEGQVVYQCRAGYTSSGTNTKSCTPEGKWTSDPVTECIVPGTTSCGSAPYIMNSSRTYSSTTAGSVAAYTCDVGFDGGSFSATCSSDGTWQFTTTYGCSPVQCGAVPAVENSDSARVSGMFYGDVVIYQCLEGYIHTGPSLKTCESNRQWSADVVECANKSSIFCADPPRRDYSVVEYESRVEGANATYTCAAGYTGPTANSQCKGDGEWSDPGIICEPVMCSSPTPIANSDI